MRKQTKLVAVLSTAALLAIGASMTSFAAQGWAEEDGTWVFYDRNGDKVTESWKKSGDNWYWLDDNGEMAVDMLVEDDDNYYYVDANGVMVTNQWVAIENEDAGDEDEPENHWYYFQANGKAYKRGDNVADTTVSTKVINGKKYAFDTDGKMLYGWVNGGERETGDDAWKGDALYYFGDENDGAMSVGWRQIHIVDDDYDSQQTQPDPDGDIWDDEQDRWFYFKSSGKKTTDEKGKTINGKKYAFDEYGRMMAEWYTYKASSSVTTDKATSPTADNGQGGSGYTSTFMYFSNPEDGARYTKGWFKVTPGYYLQKGKYDDGDEYWYYADGDGEIYSNVIKTIKGKKYAFDEYGRMISGLVFLGFNTDISTDIVYRYEDDNDDTGRYDTEDAFDEFVNDNAPEINGKTIRSYYFGSSDDGAMKTGKQTVDIDGDKFTFQFAKSGAAKGSGLIGKDDDKLYIAGKQVKADKDDKYKVYQVTDDKKIIKWETSKFVNEFGGEPDAAYAEKNDGDTLWKITIPEDEGTFYLVNTTGTLIKSKSGAKDGEDYKFKVSGYQIKEVLLEN